MGIIIILFLVGTFLIFLFSVFRVLQISKENKIHSSDYTIGFILSVALICFIVIKLIIERKANVFFPYWGMPMIMVIVPFIAAAIFYESRNRTLSRLSIWFLTCTVFSGLLLLIFYISQVDLFTCLNLEKTF